MENYLKDFYFVVLQQLFSWIIPAESSTDLGSDEPTRASRATSGFTPVFFLMNRFTKENVTCEVKRPLLPGGVSRCLAALSSNDSPGCAYSSCWLAVCHPIDSRPSSSYIHFSSPLPDHFSFHIKNPPPPPPLPLPPLCCWIVFDRKYSRRCGAVVDLAPWQTPSIAPICIHKSIGYLTLANTAGSWEWCCWVGQVTLSLVMELWWSVTAADWLEQRPRCKKWSFQFKRTLREMAGYARNAVLVESTFRNVLGHFCHVSLLAFIYWTSSSKIIFPSVFTLSLIQNYWSIFGRILIFRWLQTFSSMS